MRRLLRGLQVPSDSYLLGRRRGEPIMKKIKLTIDGRAVIVPEGSTVLQAIEKAGLYVPTLCYDSALKPFGACRLCIVEIEGMRGLPTSCTTPVQDGMKVHTE
ncbi:MAG: (2Fe-2S)-binding protein, partial [Deltaproteobacteria bacterium]|nr:(2Fe-2S)-binding protein [Deltaproteobacteria bacterium]